MLKKIGANLHEASEETCIITTGNRGWERETWWWNTEVQSKIKRINLPSKDGNALDI